MEKFSISIIGKTGSGKSFCVAALIGDKSIQKAMLGENFLGRTKTNTRYILYKKDVDTEIEVDINEDAIKELLKIDTNKSDGLVEELEKIFTGIQLNIENNENIIEQITISLKEYIEDKVTKDNYVDIFNNNLKYVKFVKNLVIKTKMSDMAKKMLKTKILEFVDTRGVFDSDKEIKRTTPSTTANIILINKNGDSEELIDMMCERVKDAFIKPVSIWIHDNDYDLDKDYSVKEELDRYEEKRKKFKNYSEKVRSIMLERGYIIPKSLDDKENIGYNLVSNSKVNVIPHVGKARGGEFKEFDLEVCSQMICKGINEIIDIYTDIQNYGRKVSKKWNENKGVIYNLVEEIAKRRSIEVCSGKISGVHKHQQPEYSKIAINAEAKYNYKMAKDKYNCASKEWVDEYIKHYSTVVAAEVLAGVNEELSEKLEALNLDYQEKVEIILIIRAIYQYIANLTPTNGYVWGSSYLTEVRVRESSYLKAEKELVEINKNFNGVPFYYTTIGENLLNNFPVSVLYCLIVNSAYGEINSFAQSDLELAINNQIEAKSFE